MIRGAVGNVVPAQLRLAACNRHHRRSSRRQSPSIPSFVEYYRSRSSQSGSMRQFCTTTIDAAAEQVAETVEIASTDTRTLRLILKLQKDVDGIPDEELELLTNSICEHYQLQVGSISIRSPATRRRSLREWHILILFESSDALQLLSYLIAESSAESLTSFESLVQRTLAPFAVVARAVLNRTRVSIPALKEDVAPEETEAARVKSLRARLSAFVQKRKYFDCIVLYHNMRTHFGVKPHMYHATLYLRACALSGRTALAEVEFRNWLRVFERANEKNLPARAEKLREKFKDNEEHYKIALAAASRIRLPNPMLDVMEDMYIARKMLPEALRIFELRNFRKSSSYNKLIALSAELGDGETALRLMSRFFAWRYRAKALSRMRKQVVFFYRPKGFTIALVMLALCRANRVRDAAQLLVDQEIRAKRAVAATPNKPAEKVALKHISDECYGILLYYLDAPERSNEFLERMSSISIRPSAGYFSWLLKTLRKGSVCTEADVLHIVSQLVEWGETPSEKIYAELFSFYLEKRKYRKVLAIYTEMAQMKTPIKRSQSMTPVLEAILHSTVDDNLALDIFDHLVSRRRLEPTHEIQAAVMRILIKSAEAKNTGFQRCLHFAKMMTLWRDQYGTTANEQILLDLLTSLSNLRRIDEISLVYRIAISGNEKPTSTIRIAIMRAFAACGRVDLVLEAWNELETGYLLYADAPGFDALIEIASGTKHLPKVLSLISNHVFLDWISAAAVYRSLLKRVILPNVNIEESKWASVVEEWNAICSNDKESLPAGIERLKKLLSTAWPSVAAKISLQ